jgi:hypothetical protein
LCWLEGELWKGNSAGSWADNGEPVGAERIILGAPFAGACISCCRVILGLRGPARSERGRRCCSGMLLLLVAVVVAAAGDLERGRSGATLPGSGTSAIAR